MFRQTVKDKTIASIKSGFYPSQALAIKSDIEDKSYYLYAGYRFLDPVGAAKNPPVPGSSDPITTSTIFRLASLSKFITAATLLKYVEDNKICLDDPLSKYFPAYENIKVIKLVSPIINSVPIISISNTGNIASITVPTLALSLINPLSLVGQLISVKSNSSPLVGLFNSTGVYKVLSPVVDNGNGTWTINVDTGSNLPWSNIPIYTLDVLTTGTTQNTDIKAIDVANSLNNLLTPLRFYYITTASVNKVTLRHLITHRSGHTYYDPVIPTSIAVFTNELSVCAGIARQLHPELRDIVPLSPIDVLKWVELTADVPLAFEPGTAWSYGAQLGIIGGVLVKYEKDHGYNKSLYEIQKQYIFDPLDMNSASYFIKNDDPERTYKINNLVHIYTTSGSLLEGFELTTPNNTLASLVDIIYGTNFSLIDGANPNNENNNPLHPVYGINAPKSLELGDAGLIMTNEDYQKFSYAMRNFGKGKNCVRILKKCTVINMSKNHIGELSITINTGFVNPPVPNQKWGYGIQVGDESSQINGLSCASMTWSGVYSGKWFVDFNSGTNFTSNSNSFADFGNFVETVNYIASETACTNCDKSCNKCRDKRH